jgi:hypothetical protein
MKCSILIFIAMKKIKILLMITVTLMHWSLFTYAENKPRYNASDEAAPPTPKTYNVTVDLVGMLSCAALNSCTPACSFEIRLYACTDCTNPSTCTLIDSKPYVYGTNSYPFKETVDPATYQCICAYFVDVTFGGCQCHIYSTYDCHNIQDDPSTSFTLSIAPCGM